MGDQPVLKGYKITNQRADAPNTTEWRDIFDLKDDGEIVNDVYAKYVDMENKQQKQAIQQQKVEQVFHQQNHKESTSESDDLSMDAEELEMLQQLKQKKNKQVQEYQKAVKYGTVELLNKITYCEAVQLKETYVVIHIFSEHLQECKKISFFCEQMADKFPTVKFCKIDFQQASQNFPEKCYPTLLIYLNNQIVKQYSGMFELGGLNLSIKEFELLLHSQQVVQSNLKKDAKNNIVEDD